MEPVIIQEQPSDESIHAIQYVDDSFIEDILNETQPMYWWVY